jgi:hypothetical protein
VERAVALVFTALAALVLAASASVTHGLSATYGAGVLTQGAGWAILVVVPAALALLFLLGARDTQGRSRAHVAGLAAGVLVVFAVTGAAAAAHGEGVHSRDQLAQASACSVDDVSMLTGLDASFSHSEPAGDPDGGCSMVVWGVPDPALAEAEVTAALERGGWQPVARDGSERVFQREDRVLRCPPCRTARRPTSG